jgi:hypothetical protein
MGTAGDVEAPGAPSGKAEAGGIGHALHTVYKASTRIVGLRQSSTSEHSNHSRAGGGGSGRDSSTAGRTPSTGGRAPSEGAGAAKSGGGGKTMSEEEKSFWSARKLKLSADGKRIWVSMILLHT